MTTALERDPLPSLSAVLATALVPAGLVFLDKGTLVVRDLGLALAGLLALRLGEDFLTEWRRYRPRREGETSQEKPTSPRPAGLVLPLVLAAWLLAGFCGLHFLRLGRWGVIGFGLLGLAAVILAAWRPEGRWSREAEEAAVFLACGPGLTVGLYYSLTGEANLWAVFLGLPAGLLAAALPLLGRTGADLAAGGHKSPWLAWTFLAQVLFSFAWVAGMAFWSGPGRLLLWGLIPLPLALAASGGVFFLDRHPARLGRAGGRIDQALAGQGLFLGLALAVEALLRG